MADPAQQVGAGDPLDAALGVAPGGAPPPPQGPAAPVPAPGRATIPTIDAAWLEKDAGPGTRAHYATAIGAGAAFAAIESAMDDPDLSPPEMRSAVFTHTEEGEQAQPGGGSTCQIGSCPR